MPFAPWPARRCAAALALLLAACSPTYDWRELRPQGSDAQALFPCRPQHLSRALPLAGAQVTMTMHACSAGDAVFALAVADLGDPARVTPALVELRDAARRNLQAEDAAAAPFAPAGATPNAEAVRLRLAGRRPDGTAVSEELALFAHGTTVYQASVLGPRLDAEAVQTWLGGLAIAR